MLNNENRPIYAKHTYKIYVGHNVKGVDTLSTDLILANFQLKVEKYKKENSIEVSVLDNCTVYEAIGVWCGECEKTTIIEIIVDDVDYDIEVVISDIVTQMEADLFQNKILLTRNFEYANV